VFPEDAEQRCWNHKILNVLDRIPRRLQGAGKPLLTRIPYVDNRAEAERLKRAFARWCTACWCTAEGCEEAAQTLERDWDRMVTFYSFPKDHWSHLRTTNPIESPFAALRLRTAAAKRFKKVTNATAVIWKLLLVAEKSFRRLSAPELLREVQLGVVFVDGVSKTNEQVVPKVAA
jgi:putative transposase